MPRPRTTPWDAADYLHTEADMVGASSYDDFMILVRAIEKAGTDRKAIVAALKESHHLPLLRRRLSDRVAGQPPQESHRACHH